MRNELLEEIEEALQIDLESPRKKKKFLAELVDVPLSSVIDNDKRLLTEIETWMNNY